MAERWGNYPFFQPFITYYLQASAASISLISVSMSEPVTDQSFFPEGSCATASRVDRNPSIEMLMP
jgi:hypothetical protein